jgi:hypothetical protein
MDAAKYQRTSQPPFEYVLQTPETGGERRVSNRSSGGTMMEFKTPMQNLQDCNFDTPVGKEKPESSAAQKRHR